MDLAQKLPSACWGKPPTRCILTGSSAAKPPEGVPGEAVMILLEPGAREVVYLTKARPCSFTIRTL